MELESIASTKLTHRSNSSFAKSPGASRRFEFLVPGSVGCLTLFFCTAIRVWKEIGSSISGIDRKIRFVGGRFAGANESVFFRRALCSDSAGSNSSPKRICVGTLTL
ncbi:hypothetical protein JWG45_08710 [Leptospira sp. 201903070]|uniref:Uncharacterized protein n=1 Tax=Leptospira ainlahdjerensis TaxID=2810033 RepID=A0ABS2UA48_9LEPT|nr:hypothetical protein [Leptospira ainlahdjerensis]MBM9577231.1 hypothetical protein [Leptospira ainlahdjerensis]